MSNSQTSGNAGPLNGIKVVDLGRYGAGPACAMILADMGAEVIKVEEPGVGDPARANPPIVGDISGYFPYYNRNKKSVTLNLREDKGKELLRRLIQWGDVLEENYRPGVMKRLGFDYPAVREINPRVVMVSVSAYGQTGPYAQRGGADPVGQAMGGIMSRTGPADGPPLSAGAPIADNTAGLFGVIGTLLALYHRQSTGLGQYVDATLVDSIMYHMGLSAISDARGQVFQRGTRQGLGGTFQAKDGTYIVILPNYDWPRMAGIIGRPEIGTAPGYRNRAERSQRGEELHGLMEAWARSHTIDEIEAILDEAGIAFGRVQTVADLLKDPNVKARGRITELDHYGEVLPLFGPFPILSDTPGSIRTPCPRLGQHNEEVYCGLLGLSPEELATLKSEGVI